MCVGISAISDFLLLYPYVHFGKEKKKRKEENYILYISFFVVVLLLYTTLAQLTGGRDLKSSPLSASSNWDLSWFQIKVFCH